LQALVPQLGTEPPDSAVRARAVLSSALITGPELARDGVLALEQGAAWTPVGADATIAEPETARRELPWENYPWA
jgi:hypothetical protein